MKEFQSMTFISRQMSGPSVLLPLNKTLKSYLASAQNGINPARHPEDTCLKKKKGLV